MSFMKPEIVHGTFTMIEGANGITYVQGNLIGGMEDFEGYHNESAYWKHILPLIGSYYEGSPDGIHSVKIIRGWGARMSAPGYLDCTDWDVFDTEQEAIDYLKEEYPESEDGEPCEPEEEDIVTSDHMNFYQNGKVIFELKEDDDHIEHLREWMSLNNFYPNVWFISDHGNAHLMELD
jgi:hypothetical protein